MDRANSSICGYGHWPSCTTSRCKVKGHEFAFTWSTSARMAELNNAAGWATHWESVMFLGLLRCLKTSQRSLYFKELCFCLQNCNRPFSGWTLITGVTILCVLCKQENMVYKIIFLKNGSLIHGTWFKCLCFCLLVSEAKVSPVFRLWCKAGFWACKRSAAGLY